MKKHTNAPSNERPLEPEVLGRGTQINNYEQNINTSYRKYDDNYITISIISNYWVIPNSLYGSRYQFTGFTR